MCQQDYAKSTRPIYTKSVERRNTDHTEETIRVWWQSGSRYVRIRRWRRSIVVRTLVSADELSLSCARLLDGWETTMWLSVSQLNHPSLRGRKMSSDPCN